MLEQDIIRKGQVNEKIVEYLEFQAISNNKKYKVESNRDSIVYTRNSEVDHLSGLYYLVPLKSYPKNKNTKKPALAVQHLRKLMSIFYKDYLNKPTAIFLLIDFTLPMAKYIILPNINDK